MFRKGEGMTHRLLPLRTQHVTVGQHLILDAWRVPAELLDDPAHVGQALRDAVEACGATLINLCVHRFSPYGVTATATLAESHMAVHTWPEHGYVGADLFFCGPRDARPAMDSLVRSFRPAEARVRELARGIGVAAAEPAADPAAGSALGG